MKTDREKWDLRYSKETGAFPSPDEFLISHASILESGRGLDVACGRGGNSIFVAERGYSVDAVDISLQALLPLQTEAVRRRLDIRCVVADLDCYSLARNLYDLVMVFYFFSKPMMTGIRDALKEGGLIFYATFNERHTSVRPEFNPAYLIPPDGLSPYFSDFDIFVHETAAGENGNVSRLIGRKPSR